MIIREVVEEDAKEYLQMLKRLDEQTKFMMFEPGERRTTLKEQKNIIKNKRENGNPIFLAEVEGEIVGFLGGTRGEYNRIRHSLYIALGILKDYRGAGIGRAFMKKIDEWSKANGIKRIELTVICENKRGVNLYKSMGFEVEGVKKASLKIDDRFVDEYYMGKVY